MPYEAHHINCTHGSTPLEECHMMNECSSSQMKSDLQSKFTEQIDLACALLKAETLANNVCQNWETDSGRPISKDALSTTVI
jgi:hypothetical protein